MSGIGGVLTKIFAGGAEKIVGALGDAFDKNFTNKEEKLEAERKIQEIITKHVQEMERLANDQFKIEVEDRASARGREASFVAATGHVDYLQWALAICGVTIFGGMIYAVLQGHVPNENRELVFHIFGIVEGVLLSIYGYYFGSSAGSRSKDLKSAK